MSRLPLIGVAICPRQIGLHAHHISGDRYVHARARVAKGVPSTLPSPAVLLAPSDILDGLDGTPITVTPFNIEPIHNSGSAFVQGTARDSARLVCAEVHTSTIAWRKLAFQRDADASTIA